MSRGGKHGQQVRMWPVGIEQLADTFGDGLGRVGMFGNGRSERHDNQPATGAMRVKGTDTTGPASMLQRAMTVSYPSKVISGRIN